MLCSRSKLRVLEWVSSSCDHNDGLFTLDLLGTATSRILTSFRRATETEGLDMESVGAISLSSRGELSFVQPV